MKCSDCPRRCGINRNKAAGFCGAVGLKLSHVQKHFFEEPIISGTNGSGTIFFSGCNLKCVFCQNYEVSRGFGKNITVKRLAEIFAELESMGVHNINLVTPTHMSLYIKQALKIYKPKIPIVYNCCGYESVSTLKSLEGLVDIYLVDAKYFSDELAIKYSNASNYLSVFDGALTEMLRQCPRNIVENGIMKKGVIIRHLILPSHTTDSVNLLRHLRENFGAEILISLMSQYVPMGDAEKFPEINRKITKMEYTRVLSRFKSLGFSGGFMQELTSASSIYTPKFDLSGVDKPPCL